MKLFALPFILLSFGLSSCSQATETAPQETQAMATSSSSTGAGNWDVNAAESHVKFTASQQGDSFTGQFNSFVAVINFDPEAVEKASVIATIDLSSLSAGDKDRDGALPGKEWFSIKKFPEAVFTSNDFAKVSENNYEARGNLTMKGKSQPLTLPFTLDITENTADMIGKVTLNRALWEVGTGAWATDEWVSTDVVIDVKIRAHHL